MVLTHLVHSRNNRIFANSSAEDVKPRTTFITRRTALVTPEENVPRMKSDRIQGEDLLTPSAQNKETQQSGPLLLEPETPTVDPNNDVFKWFNERRSYTYNHLDTTLMYSDFKLELHQALALEWMADNEVKGNGGIVADDMGLGKTIQMLAHIKNDRMRATAVGPTLIVVPKSILLQWDEEIRRFFLPDKGLTCLIYYGPKRESRYTQKFLQQTNVVLTTYGTLSKDHEHTEDEAHEIRHVHTKKAKAAFAVDAKYRWCLTGTPLQNSVHDLFSLFHFLRVENFSEDEWFRAHVTSPMTRNDPHALQASKLLKVILGNIMLRRLKTDEVNGRPILELPKLNTQVWDCDLSTPEQALYDALETRMLEIVDDLSIQLEKGGDVRIHSPAWVLLLRLRQDLEPAYILHYWRVTKYSLMRKRHVSTAQKEACARCIEMANHFSGTQPSTKITTVLRILQDIKARPGNEKTIIFSQFTSMLDLIEPFLQRQDIGFSRLDGTMETSKRSKQLKTIKTDPKVTVILLSLMAAGSGLNLIECNNVIVIDLWWNPAVEEQAVARVHRLGQTKTVNVYKLVTKNTVETRIMDLQSKKKDLATQTLHGDAMKNMEQLSNDEIYQMIGFICT
ncbi:SNF2 family N-terminal domain-containing protein [Lentinula edodes]|nr:SNF2 family N-terminal domain-containing protein [Lentinula edodes]